MNPCNPGYEGDPRDKRRPCELYKVNYTRIMEIIIVVLLSKKIYMPCILKGLIEGRWQA